MNYLSNVNTYELKLKVRIDGDATLYSNSPSSIDFKVELINPCINADLTILSSIMISTPITYEVSAPEQRESFNFDSSHVTSSEILATCPASFVFTVTD